MLKLSFCCSYHTKLPCVVLLWHKWKRDMPSVFQDFFCFAQKYSAWVAALKSCQETVEPDWTINVDVQIIWDFLLARDFFLVAHFGKMKDEKCASPKLTLKQTVQGKVQLTMQISSPKRENHAILKQLKRHKICWSGSSTPTFAWNIRC